MEKENKERNIVLINNKIIFQDKIVFLEISTSLIGNSVIKIITTAGEVVEESNPMSFLQAQVRLKEISLQIEEKFLFICSKILMSNKITFFQITEERGVCLLSINFVNGKRVSIACDNTENAFIRRDEIIAESGIDVLDFGKVNIVFNKIAMFIVSKEKRITEVFLVGGVSLVIPGDKIETIENFF